MVDNDNDNNDYDDGGNDDDDVMLKMIIIIIVSLWLLIIVITIFHVFQLLETCHVSIVTCNTYNRASVAIYKITKIVRAL